MPTALRRPATIFVVCLMFSSCPTIDTAIAQTKPAPPPRANQQAPSQTEDKAESDDQEPNDELETAAVTLDVSHSSPLIQKLYQATRETKEQDILARLTE